MRMDTEYNLFRQRHLASEKQEVEAILDVSRKRLSDVIIIGNLYDGSVYLASSMGVNDRMRRMIGGADRFFNPKPEDKDT